MVTGDFAGGRRNVPKATGKISSTLQKPPQAPGEIAYGQRKGFSATGDFTSGHLPVPAVVGKIAGWFQTLPAVVGGQTGEGLSVFSWLPIAGANYFQLFCIFFERFGVWLRIE